MKALARSTLLYTSATAGAAVELVAPPAGSDPGVTPTPAAPPTACMLKKGDLEVGLDGGNIVTTACNISRSKSLKLYSILRDR